MLSVYWIAVVLAVIGALNWGVVGLFQFDVVAALFGTMSPMSRLVYTLVGLAGIVLAVTSASVSTGRVVTRPLPNRTERPLA